MMIEVRYECPETGAHFCDFVSTKSTADAVASRLRAAGYVNVTLYLMRGFSVGGWE